MRNQVLIVVLAACLAGNSVAAVTLPEAQAVAEAWLQMIVLSDGSWGGDANPVLGQPREIAPQGAVLAYFFPVQPIGFIVVPTDKRLAPVKVWSAENDMDPDAPGGMAALVRDRLAALHGRLQPPAAAPGQPAPAGAVLEIDYVPVWDWLLGAGPPPRQAAAEDGQDMANYSAGQVLTETRWGQDQPYNNDCPFMSCTRNPNGRAIVGCVATAAAEIMRYWHWPPYGVGSPYSDAYDWVNMPVTVTAASPAAEQAAVAELSHEIGLAVGMSYGCDSSSASTADMEGVYENQYRYSTACTRRNRDDYTATTWFDLIRGEINVNRPIQYRIPGHSIVCDGWRITGTNQYHINYGWDGTNTAWYSVDSIVGGDPDEEYLLLHIYPVVGLGSYLTGTLSRNASFPYWYIYVDTACNGATVSAGQNIQFLPRVVISGSMRFESTSALWTRLFTRGDTSRGIRLTGGTIQMYGNGSLRQD